MRATSLIFTLLLGCSGDPDAKDGPKGTDPGTTSPTTPGAPSLADQLAIGKLSVYQGVEVVLWAGSGPPTQMQAPVVMGRDAAVRVFLRPDAALAGTTVTGELTLTTGGAEQLVDTVSVTLGDESIDDDLATTLNFTLDGDSITQDLAFRVTLRADGGAADDTVVWSSDELPSGVPTGDSDHLEVVILPVQYDADGSGRLPDLSQARLDEFRDAMYRIYPAQSVTVRVGETLVWDQTITAMNPLGWSRLLNAASDLRGYADEPENTYYYAMFEPMDSFYEYCAQGCILGLSNPGINTTNPSLRTSIGVGYEEYAATTMVHEIGHAHGRFHAPCGGAAGADPNYPYDGALIGTWGYDLLDGTLKDPTVMTDIMGYCEPVWVSNYTYFNLWERIDALRQIEEGARQPMREVTRLFTDGADLTEVLGPMRVGDPLLGALRVDVDLTDAAGQPAGRVDGAYTPYDHVPGGVVLLDRLLPAGWTARVHAPTSGPGVILPGTVVSGAEAVLH
ncbi:MAG: M66 family metalloprotease [Myxococcota bacterium]